LNDLAIQHHRDPLSEPARFPVVVGDEHGRSALQENRQLLHHPLSGGRVESRKRLV
jgi:hypothetical protein